jgi:hypothetical protein
MGDEGVHPILSSSGVRQGDPLAPFLFSLSIRKTLARLKDHLSSFPSSSATPPLILAYLDDIVLLTNDPLTIQRTSSFLTYTRSSLSLNVDKSTIDSFDSIRNNGINLLGTAVGSRAFRLNFLTKKVQQQVDIITRLPSLSFQSAFILTKRCIQQNLRHLQRQLKTDDLTEVWHQLDSLFQHTILTLRSSPRSLPTDASIISLPVRLGGLGILSHAEISPHARAASDEAADRFLSSILGLPSDDTIPLTSQSSRVSQVLVTRHLSLLSSLTPHQQASLQENASLLGRLALDALPTSKAFSLTNREVSAALHHHTLCPSAEEVCRCGDPNVFGHAEICPSFNPWTTARHEIVKRQMISHISSNPSLSVKAEPRVVNAPNNLRTDFRVTSESGVSEYDLTIISLATQDAMAADKKTRRNLSLSIPSISPLALSKASIQSSLQAAVQKKVTKYERFLTVPFHPIVISLGGMLEDKAVKELERWREAIGGASYGFMMRRISVTLLRARARVWRFE